MAIYSIDYSLRTNRFEMKYSSPREEEIEHILMEVGTKYSSNELLAEKQMMMQAFVFQVDNKCSCLCYGEMCTFGSEFGYKDKK